MSRFRVEFVTDLELQSYAKKMKYTSFIYDFFRRLVCKDTKKNGFSTIF